MTTTEQIISTAALRLKLGKKKDIAERMGMEYGTFTAHLREPRRINIVWLNEYAKTLHLTDDEILKIIKTAKK